MRSLRHRAVLSAVGATAILVLATACSSDSGDSTAQAPSGTIAETTPDAPTTQAPPADASPATSPPATENGGTDSTPAVVVPEELRFTAPLVGGGTFDGAAAAGKPTVFWFWAPT